MAVLEAAALEEQFGATVDEGHQFADGEISCGSAPALAAGVAGHKPCVPARDGIDVEAGIEEELRVRVDGVGREVIRVAVRAHLERIAQRRSPRDITGDQAWGHGPASEVGMGADGDDGPRFEGLLIGEVADRHCGHGGLCEHDVTGVVEHPGRQSDAWSPAGGEASSGAWRGRRPRLPTDARHGGGAVGAGLGGRAPSAEECALQHVTTREKRSRGSTCVSMWAQCKNPGLDAAYHWGGAPAGVPARGVPGPGPS